MNTLHTPTFLVLLVIRPLCILCVQIVVFFLVGSWNATFPWWPFQMILTNCLCFVILLTLMKRDGRPLRQLYLHPFHKGIALGKLTVLLEKRQHPLRILNMLYDVGLFVFILLTLGFIALKSMSAIDHFLQTTVTFTRYDRLPFWAVASITILLPLTMPLTEIPWYFGYFFPKLEQCFGRKTDEKIALVKAFTLTTLVFSFQHCFQPFFLNATFLALRAIMLLPLLILIAWVIRIIPRLTPYILFLHMLMAIEVAFTYWEFS